MLNRFEEAIDGILKNNTQFKKEAYYFLNSALKKALMRYKKTPNHIHAKELLSSCKELGLDQYGPLTSIVFSYWGINSSQDIGKIVYSLITAGVWSRANNDKESDFDEDPDFNTLFSKNKPPSIQPATNNKTSKKKKKEKNE